LGDNQLVNQTGPTSEERPRDDVAAPLSPSAEPDAAPPVERADEGQKTPSPSSAPARPQHVIERTRAGGLWTAVAVGLIVLILILVFVAQNSAAVRIHLLWFDWTLALGLALLIATVLGALLMAAIGTVRILQLRRVASHHDHRERRRPRFARNRRG
jgi:lipopolysaccharide assembly protein A